MITTDEAKALARELAALPEVTHSRVLEAVAHASGLRDWNTFAALAARTPDAVVRQQVIPILRMFDHQLARRFYCDFLGFEWQWQHEFEPDLPVYAQVAREGSVLHLSEHHGDATPGGGVMITVADLRSYHAGLLAQAHRNARPGIEQNPWGLTLTVLDPFGNRLTFWQRNRSEG